MQSSKGDAKWEDGIPSTDSRTGSGTGKGLAVADMIATTGMTGMTAMSGMTDITTGAAREQAERMGHPPLPRPVR